MPPKKTVKSRVEKPYNSGTMSKSAFWGMIRSCLRNTSRWWKPIAEAKKNAKRAKKDGGRQKFEYQCNKCKNWFPEKSIQVDHIVGAGTLACKEDVGDFIERLFCEKEGLQVLCSDCHLEKTNSERSNKQK